MKTRSQRMSQKLRMKVKTRRVKEVMKVMKRRQHPRKGR